ncbi:hypothetical protein CANINC_004107, partial [Pichia inconspicua]
MLPFSPVSSTVSSPADLTHLASSVAETDSTADYNSFHDVLDGDDFQVDGNGAQVDGVQVDGNGAQVDGNGAQVDGLRIDGFGVVPFLDQELTSGGSDDSSYIPSRTGITDDFCMGTLVDDASSNALTRMTTGASMRFFDELEDRMIAETGGRYNPLLPLYLDAAAAEEEYFDSESDWGPGVFDNAFGLPLLDTVFDTVDVVHDSATAANSEVDTLSNSDNGLINNMSEASLSTPNPLVRTISQVTNSDGPSPKRVALFCSMFSVLNPVHQALISYTSDAYLPSTIFEAIASPAADLWIAAINKELKAHSVNAAQFDLEIHQMDVTTAFLNGDLMEEIYMHPPSGSPFTGKVFGLKKSIYGLKQAPLCWNLKINQVLIDLGFNRSMAEFGVYSKVVEGKAVLVALYVDDLLIISNDSSNIKDVKFALSSHFQMKDLGLVSTFLGMQVKQESGRVTVSLERYLRNFLSDFNMGDCNSVTTPLVAGSSLVPDGTLLSSEEASRYRTMVGKLLFAANTVRPDLVYAASALSRYIKEPHRNHMVAGKHVLRYIKGSLNKGLVFKKQKVFKLVGYCDSDWAGDKADRKSITGYTFLLGNTAVTWKSTKQQTVALSSTEAEYMALGDAVKELLWLKQ